MEIDWLAVLFIVAVVGPIVIFGLIYIILLALTILIMIGRAANSFMDWFCKDKSVYEESKMTKIINGCWKAAAINFVVLAVIAIIRAIVW